MTNSPAAAVVLALHGETVTQLKFDFGFTILTEHSETRIEQPFRLTAPDGQADTVDPENPTHEHDLVALHQTTVDGGCFDDGSLELRFSNGLMVNVPSNLNYEAWTVTRRDGEMAVANPGGGVTTFGPRLIR